jgi:hypothetical protein
MNIAVDCRLWRAGCAAGLTALLIQGVPQPATAQGSVEELERKIEAAENKKKREGDRPADKPAAASAGRGSLLVQVDEPCDLRVGGQSVRSFKAPGSAVITVEAGQTLIECVSTATPGGAKASEVIDVSIGQHISVSLSFAQADARARTVLEAASKRFKAISGDVVSDTKAGVEWTRSDNGSDVNWSQAQSHCRRLGGGWSLPTSAQLESLYNARLPGIRCRGLITCHVSELFHLSNWWFWSSETNNATSKAWGVSLNDGDRASTLADYSADIRALCVRRP